MEAASCEAGGMQRRGVTEEASGHHEPLHADA